MATLKLIGFKEWLTQVEGDYIVWQEKEEKRLNDAIARPDFNVPDHFPL